MEKYRTTFLKIVLLLVGIVILALCVFWLPMVAEYFVNYAPEFAYLQYPLLIGIYVTTLPFYFALYQTFKLLRYINQNRSFSNLTVKALKYIKISAVIIGVLYVFGVFFLDYQGAGQPGVSLLGLTISLASVVIAVFAAVLQELVSKAVAIKEENNLTI